MKESALQEARRLGKTRYFTGKPCLRGHISERLVCNRKCIKCAREDEKYRNPITQKLKARRNSWTRKHFPTPTRPCPEVCEMCGNPPKNRALHLDHDHATGRFRGWICSNCNTTLGKLGDSESAMFVWVNRALNYLRRDENASD